MYVLSCHVSYVGTLLIYETFRVADRDSLRPIVIGLTPKRLLFAPLRYRFIPATCLPLAVPSNGDRLLPPSFRHAGTVSGIPASIFPRPLRKPFRTRLQWHDRLDRSCVYLYIRATFAQRSRTGARAGPRENNHSHTHVHAYP